MAVPGGTTEAVWDRRAARGWGSGICEVRNFDESGEDSLIGMVDSRSWR